MISTLWEAEPVARQHHYCTSCERTINPGEKYRRTRVVSIDADVPYTLKECAHCRAFVSLYLKDFCPDPWDGWSRDDVEEWDPGTAEAREHKRQWSIQWRHGRDLYPVPSREEVVA